MSLTAVRWIEHAPLQSGTRLAKRLGTICIITMICASFIVPPITSPRAALWVKAEQLLLPLAVLVYALMLLAGLARPIRFNGMFVIGGVYCAAVLLSMWTGSVLLQESIIPRDLFEPLKVWLPVAFFVFAYEAELSEAGLRLLLKLYGFSLLLVCLYAWAQWLGLSFTYDVLNQFYSAGTHDDALLGARRVYATMGNPNLLGQLMTWGIPAFVLAALSGVGSRAWNAVVAFSCLVTLAMTGSRYGLLNAGLIFVLILAMPSYSRRRQGGQRAALIIGALAFAVVFGIVATSNQATLERYQTLRNPGQVDSLQGRLVVSWHAAASDFLQSPLLGRGPSKLSYFFTYTDSEFLDVLKLYGVIGFSVYLLYFLFPLRILIRGLKAARRAGPFLEDRMPATLLTLRLSTIMVVSAIVMNIGMATFYSAMIQGLLWMWLGVGARCAETIGNLSGTIAEHPRNLPGRLSPGVRDSTRD